MSKSISKSDFEKICRTCLLEEENMLSVYSSHILEMLQSCTKLKIKSLDGLPHQICSQCVGKVTAFYAFKQESEKSDCLLRTIAKTNAEKGKKKCKVDSSPDSSLKNDNDIKLEVEDFLINNLKVELDTDNVDTNTTESEDDKTLSKTCEEQNSRSVDKENRKFICLICSEEFSGKNHLIKHLITRHKSERKYNCKNCEKQFYDVCTMASDGKPFNLRPMKCDVCKKDFMLHLRLNTYPKQVGEFKHFCKTCGKGFRIKAKLKEHEISHEKHGNFPCIKCDKWFKHKRNLKKHFINFHEGTMRKKEVCNQCGKMVMGLKRHMILMHSLNKPHKCQHCTKTFANICNLKNHIKVHTGETKNYTELCNICGKKFQTASDLKIHIRSHTGEKPYACSVCNKAYKTHSALSVHKRLHTGQRPFSCQFCGKAFFTSNVLKCHLRVHTGEKPFTCKICGRGFSQKKSVKTHLKVHE